MYFWRSRRRISLAFVQSYKKFVGGRTGILYELRFNRREGKHERWRSLRLTGKFQKWTKSVNIYWNFEEWLVHWFQETSWEVKYGNERYGIMGLILTKDTNSSVTGNKIWGNNFPQIFQQYCWKNSTVWKESNECWCNLDLPVRHIDRIKISKTRDR
jgi:hypothetical protein